MQLYDAKKKHVFKTQTISVSRNDSTIVWVGEEWEMTLKQLSIKRTRLSFSSVAFGDSQFGIIFFGSFFVI